MKKVPFVINCEQLDIDTQPDKSWVLKDLDGECYLEKMIRLAIDSTLFSHVYLQIPDDEQYEVYKMYSGEDVTIIVGSKSDYVWEKKHHARTWNIYNRDYETIPCWNYLLAKKLGVEFVYSIDAYALMPSMSLLKRAISAAFGDLHTHYIVTGVGYIQGLIYPVKYLEKFYYQDTPIGKLKCLDFAPLKSFKKVTDLDLINKYKKLERECLSFSRQECFGLIKSYFVKYPNKFDLSDDTQALFYKFMNENIQKLEKLEKVQRVTLDKTLSIDALEKLLIKSRGIGRLSIVFSANKSFDSWETFIKLIQSYDLHYIFLTDGELDDSDLQTILKVVDIVEFELNDFSIQRLKEKDKSKDYDKILHSFNSVLDYRKTYGTPQIGINCSLTKDSMIQYEIINYWFHRIDFCKGISSFQIIGDQEPKVQYVKYSNESNLHIEAEGK
ncbi:MAG: hypothetical protein KC646_05985 [Candidatus Cloacimonetes bacterium]|nr:hypothetical protein [Candidatus Cloacimonadota bacterium]